MIKGSIRRPIRRSIRRQINGGSGSVGIARNFTTLQSVLSQSYMYATALELNVGDKFEIDWRAPTGLVSLQETIFDGDDSGVGNRGIFSISGSTYNLPGTTSVYYVDDVVVTTSTSYPLDGELHKVRMEPTELTKVKVIGKHQKITSGLYFNGIAANAKATISGFTTINPIGELGGTTEVSTGTGTANSLTPTNLAPADTDSYTLDGCTWDSGTDQLEIFGCV